MACLTDILEVNQQEFERHTDFNIRAGYNLLVFGPSGGGKTAIVRQACERNHSLLSWCNLSVNERPDIQGWPKVSPDGLVAEFATPTYLPLPETRNREEKIALQAALEVLDKKNSVLEVVKARIEEIQSMEKNVVLSKALPYLKTLNAPNMKDLISEISRIEKEVQDKQQKVTLMFDEADKAPHEVLQPLLELLQFHTLNGRKVSIHSCVLTCNMPDENAHTEKLSHAITNRTFIYKMYLDFDVWRKWAVPNGVHPLIVGYLASHKENFHKKPSNNDDTAYAHPSPRAWTEASDSLFKLEKDSVLGNLGKRDETEMQSALIAGKVGHKAALDFEIWLKHYQKLDPMVEQIVSKGTSPNLKDLGLEERLILAISACARINNELKPNNKEKILKVCKNVFVWLKELDIDLQTAGVRNTLDFKTLRQYQITDIPEVMNVFKTIKDRTDNINF